MIARVARTLVMVGAVAAFPIAARAQQSATAAPQPGAVHNEPFVLGAVLKIVARSLGSDPVVGRVDSLRGEWVVLDTVAPRMDGGLFESNTVPVDRFRFLAVRAQDIRSVEVRTGNSKLTGVLKYGLIGAGVGGLVGGLSNGQGVNPSGADFLSGFLIGASVGGVVGGTLGYFSGNDHWKKVPGPYYLNEPR
ncbi:MAG: hypothetical protein HY275_08880 [Gemmatimonadetes bacterium]|nr:hypothetical protein [Gemmatimonadota bacterium]